MSRKPERANVPAPVPFVLAPQRSDGEPFTTSEIIADGTGVGRRKVKDAIRKYRAELEAFGKVASYQTAFEPKAETISASYQAEIKGQETRGRKAIGYILNEQQATFLLTLLKNTPVVVEFKRELVRQFFVMREELAHRRELRAIGKPIRRSLTDALRDSGEVERMKGHAYGTYTNLAFKLATGKTARQLRQERGADKAAHAVDFLTAEELVTYQRKEAAITVLLDAGLCYDNIKAVLVGEVSRA